MIAPTISEADSDGNFHQWVRPIKIEDLLGRAEININLRQVAEEFRGKVVLVTGAAGSIGSELCRQLVQMGIQKLIMSTLQKHLCIMSVLSLRKNIQI